MEREHYNVEGIANANMKTQIRNALESIGRSQLLGRHKTLTVDERERMVYEIINALDYLKKNKIGALIVIVVAAPIVYNFVCFIKQKGAAARSAPFVYLLLLDFNRAVKDLGRGACHKDAV